MARKSAKAKAKLLEAFLTAQNENAKALADIASGVSALRFRVMLSINAEEVLKKVEGLETVGNRIIDSPKNRQILKELDALGDAFIKAAAATTGPAREISSAVRATVDNATKAMQKLVATSTDDVVVAAFERDVVSYATGKVYRSYASIAAEFARGSRDIVAEAIAKYSGNKEDLVARLFSKDGADHFRKLNAEMQERATRLADSAIDRLNNLKATGETLENVRDAFKVEFDAYLEKRREYVKGDKTLFNEAGTETRSVTEVKREMMDAHQDNVNRIAAEKYKTPLFVNAKNTSHDDNCVDAMDEEPMTEAEWQASAAGLPRGPKRDCTVYCQCVLYPVGDDSEPDDVIIESGREVSAPEAQGL